MFVLIQSIFQWTLTGLWKVAWSPVEWTGLDWTWIQWTGHCTSQSGLSLAWLESTGIHLDYVGEGKDLTQTHHWLQLQSPWHGAKTPPAWPMAPSTQAPSPALQKWTCSHQHRAWSSWGGALCLKPTKQLLRNAHGMLPSKNRQWPMPYHKNLAPLPSPLQPHCPANQRLHLWCPLIPQAQHTTHIRKNPNCKFLLISQEKLGPY